NEIEANSLLAEDLSEAEFESEEETILQNLDSATPESQLNELSFDSALNEIEANSLLAEADDETESKISERVIEENRKNAIKQEIEEMISPFGYMFGQSPAENENNSIVNNLQVIKSDFEADLDLDDLLDKNQDEITDEIDSNASELNNGIKEIDEGVNDLFKENK
ncbi:MAG: hypothetical protein QNJ38_20625, partial [Prochloraceae cyanobacterium]|nr:hypothetical protein [Prochloraceae cyanobacterium]